MAYEEFEGPHLRPLELFNGCGPSRGWARGSVRWLEFVGVAGVHVLRVALFGNEGLGGEDHARDAGGVL